MGTLNLPSAELDERLAKVFPPRWLHVRAWDHGVIVRDRKVNITAMVLALVLDLAVGNNRIIEEIRQTYVRFADRRRVRPAFTTG